MAVSLVGLLSSGRFDDFGWSWGRLDFLWDGMSLVGVFGARWVCQFIVGVMSLAYTRGFDWVGGRRRTDRRWA